MDKKPVVIVGAGIPGASLAIHLANAGVRIILLDRATRAAMRPTGLETRTAAIMGQGVEWLRQCDAFNPNKYTKMCGLQISDCTQQPVIPRLFHAKEIGQDCFGYNCDIATLREALITRAAKHKHITLMLGQTIEDIAWVQSHVTISLAGGRKPVETPLIIAADGRQSLVRKKSGIGYKETPYTQQAITAVLSHDNAHGYTSREYHYAGGPMTFVPFNGHHSSLVWVMNASDVAAKIEKPKQNIAAMLEQKSQGDYHNIQILSDLETTPLGCVKADQITTHRCALIAEAAHAISPIGAQGLNMSLRDAQALYDTIMQARKNGLDIGRESALAPYNKQYKTDITPRVFAIDHFHQNVTTDHPAAHHIRRGMLKIISSQPMIRRFLMRQGLANS